MTKKNKNILAFTLAEIMIVMLVLTILLAAFAPLMTKKSKVDLSSPWRWAANNNDIYYGMGNNQTAMIGQNNKANGDPNAKLLIGSSNGSTNPHITFKEGNDILGHLIFRDSNILVGARTDVNNRVPALGGTNNIAIGRDVLKQNTTGTNNITIGQNVLSNISDIPNDNVMIGSNIQILPFKAGGKDYIVGGHIAIGRNIQVKAASSAGGIFIGKDIDHSISMGNPVIIGHGACNKAPSGNVISGCIGNDAGNMAQDGALLTNFYLGGKGDQIILGGFGSTLTLNQYLLFDSFGRPTSTSDKRLKNIGNENTYGLNVLKKLKVYNYTWKDDKKKVPQIGVIAQDVQKLMPEAVSKNDKGFYVITKDYITYSMLNAIKELDKMLQDVIAQVKTLATQVANHETRIEALQKENKELKEKVQALEKQNKKIEQQNKTFESRLNALEKKL